MAHQYLSKEQVGILLEHWDFDSLVTVFKNSATNGAMLECVDSPDILEDLGVTNKVMQKALYLKIEQAKSLGGVPGHIFRRSPKFVSRKNDDFIVDDDGFGY